VTVGGAAVGLAILLVVAIPRYPPVWSFVWGWADIASGGVEDRERVLRNHPFPADLAPLGYRIVANEQMCDDDVEDCSDWPEGWTVSFAGPDDENTIQFYSQGMIADEVYHYWRRAQDNFGRTKLVPVENLRPRSFCEEGDDVFHENHEVSCVAAFDGMAVIADSVNAKPERGSIEHAVTMLRAGVAHWESIRD
jgi:hypothetical protein